MNRTPVQEESRKEKIFEKWNQLIHRTDLRLARSEFVEIYEGIAVVSDLSKNRIGFHLEDGRKLRHIPLDSQITYDCSRFDLMRVTLGLKAGRWCLIDIISIDSVIDYRRGKVHHMSNPLTAPLAP